jgi:hypothetical protein
MFLVVQHERERAGHHILLIHSLYCCNCACYANLGTCELVGADLCAALLSDPPVEGMSLRLHASQILSHI